MLKISQLILATVILNLSVIQAQTLTSVVIDSASQKPIPYVTVQLKNKGVITNEEGRFTFLLGDNIIETDTLFISCIGYKSLAEPINRFTESTIYLAPKAIELKEVIVTNKNYTADEIMDLVEDNLEKNYKQDLSKKRLFHRRSNFDTWNKSDFTVKKSTIDVLDQRFLDSVISTVPKYNSYYQEIAGDFYEDYNTDTQKLDLLKASKLYDKSLEFDEEKMEKKFNEILRKNVKKGSYFKIKSGLFGTKIDAEEVSELFQEEIDSTDVAAVNKELEEKKKAKEEQKKDYAKWKRTSLVEIFNSLPTHEDSDLNFIYKTRKYEYLLREFTYMGSDAVYVIDFRPDGSADYKGTLYINSDDFAVIRVDYENIKPVKKFNLLGISANNYLAKGKIIYTKGINNTYGLRYFESESGTRFGIKRPLKIIEKNKIVKGKNKQNELSGKIDFTFNNVEKKELVIFESQTISQASFDAFKEDNSVLPTYMPKYDPEFWKDYTIIEPNTAIRDFTSISEDEE